MTRDSWWHPYSPSQDWGPWMTRDSWKLALMGSNWSLQQFLSSLSLQSVSQVLSIARRFLLYKILYQNICFTKCIQQKFFLNSSLGSCCVKGMMMENQTVSVHSNDHWDRPVESCYKKVVSSNWKANEVIPNGFAGILKLTSLDLVHLIGYLNNLWHPTSCFSSPF